MHYKLMVNRYVDVIPMQFKYFPERILVAGSQAYKQLGFVIWRYKGQAAVSLEH